MALVAVLAALLASVGQSNAQSCAVTDDLGTLQSNQTITRVELLLSSDCQWDDGRYHDWYTFELPGGGEVRAELRSSDFGEQIQFNAASGDLLAHANRPATLTRTLPAGRFRVIATSRWARSTGTYTLALTTGRLATPPPPPPPVEEPISGDEQVVLPGEAEIVSGHVIARVHPLPENDRRGRYRIEFGFLSAEVLASGTDRAAVVDANTHLLPPRRYLNEASLLARGRANDRRWLRSDLVDVLPMGGDDAGLSGEPLLTGRVIARWNPTAGGRFRVEFGFLPDWAFEAAGDDTERAAELYAELLPQPGRYLTENRINSELRRDEPRWLTSSVVEISPPHDLPPLCGEVTITPAGVPITLKRGERITDEAIATIYGQLAETFTPVVVNGLPPGLTYDHAESRADGCEYQVTVSGTIPPQTPARDYSVSITAEGAVGDPTTQTVLIKLDTLRPGIEWGGYNPETTSIGGSVGIVQPRVVQPVPAPPGVVWSFETRTTDVCSVDSRTGALTLIGAGACQVTVTASVPGYRPATASAQVTVDPTEPCVISWSGYSRSSIDFGDTAPTHREPQCRVNGRMHSPEWLYSVAPGSSDVCRVNEATGALRINGAGQCRILLTNVPKPPEYGAGSAEASVRVEPGDPELRWQGYSPGTTQLDDQAPQLLRPTAAARSIEFSYNALTPSICEVDSETGALTLTREGNCIVMVSTSGNPNYRTETARATVVVSGTQKPEIDSINCSPSRPDVGDRVTCEAELSGGEPDEWLWFAGSSDGAERMFTTTFDAPGRQLVWLSVSNSAGNDNASTPVEVGPGIERPDVTISCSPSSIDEGESVTCRVDRNRGGPIDDYDWRASGGSPSSSSSSTYSPRFRSEGSYTVRLTASNSAGDDDTKSANVTVRRGVQPPSGIRISCSPSSIHEGESVTCSVTRNRGGPIDDYDWRASGGSPSSSSSSTYSPTFRSEGSYTVRLTASNSAGDDDDSTTVGVGPDIERPDPSISCTARVLQGDRASCRVDRNRGGDIDRYSWSATGGASSGSSSTYRPRFSSYGRQTVSLTASNDGGSGSNSLSVDVVADPEGWTYARCGSDRIKVYWFNSTNLTKHWLNMTWEEIQIRVPGWGEHWIGRLSQDECNSWPDGRIITDDTWDG